MNERYDVLIIGAGVIGCAVARELSRYRLKIGVLEKELDVACGNSGRNSGVLHGGFTYKKGSLKAACCVEGNREFDAVAEELGVPFRRLGKVVVGFTEADMESLVRFKAVGEGNGVRASRSSTRNASPNWIPAQAASSRCILPIPESWIRWPTR